MGFGEFVRRAVRNVGRQYGQARESYETGKREARVPLPTDEDGRVQIVCRRYAERRTVALDGAGRPACFDATHADCQGCVEDIRAGRIETW